MSADPEADLDEISKRFSALWQSLVRDGEHPRREDDRRSLVDSVRDALDRGESRLRNASPEFIANTFSLEARIQDGPSTQVFRARHRDLGSLHAVKLLHPDHASDPVARQLLLREAAIGLSLRHPRIVQTQALLRLEDGRPAVIGEWCGTTLAHRMTSRCITHGEIVSIMIGLLEGLSALHDQGHVHCDVSPTNIFFDDTNPAALKIGDLGIALPSGARHEKLDIRFAGQAPLAAPEQKEGELVDARTDLYAAGRVLSLLLAQRNSPRDPDLQSLANKLSQQRPDDRPQNAKAALQMLGGL